VCTHGRLVGACGAFGGAYGPAEGTHVGLEGIAGAAVGTHGAAERAFEASEDTHGAFECTYGRSECTHGRFEWTHGASGCAPVGVGWAVEAAVYAVENERVTTPGLWRMAEARLSPGVVAALRAKAKAENRTLSDVAEERLAIA